MRSNRLQVSPGVLQPKQVFVITPPSTPSTRALQCIAESANPRQVYCNVSRGRHLPPRIPFGGVGKISAACLLKSSYPASCPAIDIAQTQVSVILSQRNCRQRLLQLTYCSCPFKSWSSLGFYNSRLSSSIVDQRIINGLL